MAAHAYFALSPQVSGRKWVRSSAAEAWWAHNLLNDKSTMTRALSAFRSYRCLVTSGAMLLYQSQPTQRNTAVIPTRCRTSVTFSTVYSIQRFSNKESTTEYSSERSNRHGDTTYNAQLRGGFLQYTTGQRSKRWQYRQGHAEGRTATGCNHTEHTCTST
jgi:hypothetical protein